MIKFNPFTGNFDLVNPPGTSGATQYTTLPTATEALLGQFALIPGADSHWDSADNNWNSTLLNWNDINPATSVLFVGVLNSFTDGYEWFNISTGGV